MVWSLSEFPVTPLGPDFPHEPGVGMDQSKSTMKEGCFALLGLQSRVKRNLVPIYDPLHLFVYYRVGLSHGIFSYPGIEENSESDKP